MKPFANNPAFISEAASLDAGQSPGFSVFSPFPAPGQPSSSQNTNQPAQSNSSNGSQPPTAFSGRGISVGESRTGYQGGSNSNYSSQQNVRDVPKGPNPLTQKSKLVQEHNQKNRGQEEVKEEDDLEAKPDSSESKDEEEDLINLT